MRAMPAVVTPQTVINDCMGAVRATGCEPVRGQVMNNLPFDHFGFCVGTTTYHDLLRSFTERLDDAVQVEVPAKSGASGFRNRAVFGQQRADDKSLCWYSGQTLPALALVEDGTLPLIPGGGYIAVLATNLQAPYQWLRRQGVAFQQTALYGRDALWVNLTTPDYGIGSDYYGLAVVTESLLETARRLPVYDL